MLKKTAVAISFCICAVLLHAQAPDITRYHEIYRLAIHKSTDAIKVDGELDETSWKQSAVAENFWQLYPADTAAARRETKVRMTYDANNLYVAFVCYDTGYYVIQSLKRDSDPGSSDGVGIVLDPLNSRTNGFFFAVNPYNVQTEDLLNANNGDLSFSWDNKWFSQTKRHADHWVAEMAIPFKTLRYAAGKKLWGINFVRADLKNNEYSIWARVPVNLNFFDFGYTGALSWDVPPPTPKKNIAFIPYSTGGISRNKEDNEKMKATFNAGFDAKVALSSKMNLDITVNPDFSQVEVDKQVTNLTRFNIFFPERRTFFLENADLYANYGIPPIRPFYSRTIGLDKDGNRIPIIAGLRLTGNLDDKTRIGLMNIQTAAKGDFAAQNYTAVSASHRLLKRSVIKGYYFGREGLLNEQQKLAHPLDRYGRNAGTEFVYQNNDNTWNAWGGFHKSWKYGVKGQDTYLNGGFGYNSRIFSSITDYDFVGVNYYTDMGFVQRIENYDAVRDTSIRVGFQHIFNSSTFKILPEKGNINSHVFESQTFIVWNANGSFNERNNDFAYSINFKNTSQFTAGFSNADLQLMFPISFTDSTPLPVARYHYTFYKTKYSSDNRKKLVFGAGVAAGNFYNGTLQQYTASLKFRAQPWGNFGVEFEQDELRFPGAYGKTSLFLVSPRAEVNFSNNLFWTTFLQYNTQADNFNINSRLQWRFKPMSDLFVVYTDNYFNSPFLKNRNRGLVFKLNYWFSL
ncbi:MAG: DUF5916 domain-containing protein [Ferruginibacter sp.]